MNGARQASGWHNNVAAAIETAAVVALVGLILTLSYGISTVRSPSDPAICEPHGDGDKALPGGSETRADQAAVTARYYVEQGWVSDWVDEAYMAVDCRLLDLAVLDGFEPLGLWMGDSQTLYIPGRYSQAGEERWAVQAWNVRDGSLDFASDVEELTVERAVEARLFSEFLVRWREGEGFLEVIDLSALEPKRRRVALPPGVIRGIEDVEGTSGSGKALVAFDGEAYLYVLDLKTAKIEARLQFLGGKFFLEWYLPTDYGVVVERESDAGTVREWCNYSNEACVALQPRNSFSFKVEQLPSGRIIGVSGGSVFEISPSDGKEIAIPSPLRFSTTLGNELVVESGKESFALYRLGFGGEGPPFCHPSTRGLVAFDGASDSIVSVGSDQVRLWSLSGATTGQASGDCAMADRVMVHDGVILEWYASGKRLVVREKVAGRLVQALELNDVVDFLFANSELVVMHSDRVVRYVRGVDTGLDTAEGDFETFDPVGRGEFTDKVKELQRSVQEAEPAMYQATEPLLIPEGYEPAAVKLLTDKFGQVVVQSGFAGLTNNVFVEVEDKLVHGRDIRDEVVVGVFDDGSIVTARVSPPVEYEGDIFGELTEFDGRSPVDQLRVYDLGDPEGEIVDLSVSSRLSLIKHDANGDIWFGDVNGTLWKWGGTEEPPTRIRDLDKEFEELAIGFDGTVLVRDSQRAVILDDDEYEEVVLFPHRGRAEGLSGSASSAMAAEDRLYQIGMGGVLVGRPD